MAYDHSIWAEKYRPQTYDEYVWRDETLRAKAEQWKRDRCVPHVLFCGDPGVGKTSLAFLLLKEIGISTEDILYIPASRKRKIDDVMDQITAFVQTWAWNDTGMKYVILDEADSLSQAVQKALRADMEVFEANCRFILTANYQRSIIEPLLSRVETYQFASLNHDEFVLRLAEVMSKEGVSIEREENMAVMTKIVDTVYPDLRKSIGLLQQACLTDADGTKVLRLPSSDAATTKPYLLTAANLIKEGRLKDARKLIVENTLADEYVGIYKWMYQNLQLWGPTEDQHDDALLAIRRGLVHHSVVADVEINLAATLVELGLISKKHV